MKSNVLLAIDLPDLLVHQSDFGAKEIKYLLGPLFLCFELLQGVLSMEKLLKLKIMGFRANPEIELGIGKEDIRADAADKKSADIWLFQVDLSLGYLEALVSVLSHQFVQFLGENAHHYKLVKLLFSYL